MKILVPIKRVIDANIKVRVKPDQSGVELNNVKISWVPWISTNTIVFSHWFSQGFVQSYDLSLILTGESAV